jgi:hypothetical protein
LLLLVIVSLMLSPARAAITTLKTNIAIGVDSTSDKNDFVGCDFLASNVDTQNTQSGVPTFLIGGRTNSMYLVS